MSFDDRLGFGSLKDFIFLCFMFSKFCLSLTPCDHMLAKGPLCSPVNLVVVSIFQFCMLCYRSSVVLNCIYS